MIKMKLLTKAIRRKIPALYAQDDLGDRAIAWVKFFTPDGNWTWYATEFDPETRIFRGLVIGFVREFGPFSLDELESSRGPLGLPVERDKWFTPCALSEIK